MICKFLAIAFFALLATADAQIDGKYTFESQQNFDAFIGSVVGDSGDKYTALLNARPKFEVSHDGGDKYTITRITPTNRIVFTFNLGEAVTADPLGAGLPAQYTTTLENGALVSRAGDITISRVFSPSEMVLNFSKGPITASRHCTRTA